MIELIEQIPVSSIELSQRRAKKNQIKNESHEFSIL